MNVISEALRALADGDAELAGDRLAHALEGGDQDAVRQALGYLKVGDVEKAMALLESLCEGDKAEEPKEEPQKEQESIRISEMARSVEGKEWEVVLIQAGTSKNGNFYPAQALEAAVPMFEGAKAYDSHVTDEQMKANPGRKVGELLGWFDRVHWDGKREAVVGHFHAAASWLREMMLNAYQDGKTDLLGFSIDAYVNANKRQMEGKDVNYVESFEKVNSVDVVCEPAAGGEVIRVVAGITTECKRGKRKMTKEEIVNALKEATAEDRLAIAEALKGELVDGEQVTEEEEDEETPVSEALLTKVYNMELREQVRDSGLPKEAQELVMGIYENKPATSRAEVKRTIESQRALLDRQVKTQVNVPITARPVFDVNAGAAALHRMLGVASPEETDYLKRNEIGWMGVREWYTNFTGDDEFLGKVSARRVTEANVTTTSANSVVKNALNKALAVSVAGWESSQWWKKIVDEQDAANLNDITAVKTASLAPLNVVSEGETYAELSFSDAEETASFVKYGAYLGITLESVMKDDLNYIRNLPKKLADAWAYAVSDRVSTVFTAASGAGPTLTETSRALMNTTDGNLGTTALSYAQAVAIRTAMRKLTALGNARRIGLSYKYILVPPDLESTAIQIRDSEKDPDNAENGINTMRNQFEVVVVNDWTDTNNYYCLADPKVIPVIQLWYYRGQRTPQLFAAEDEANGALFTNDTYRYKARFFMARAIVDWRGIYGSVV